MDRKVIKISPRKRQLVSRRVKLSNSIISGKIRVKFIKIIVSKENCPILYARERKNNHNLACIRCWSHLICLHLFPTLICTCFTLKKYQKDFHTGSF